MKKLALITGGTAGIGAAIAQRLAEEFDLALGFNSDFERAQVTKSSLLEKFPERKVEIFSKNLVDHKSCEELYQDVLRTFGRSPSALIHCAGKNENMFFLSANFKAIEALLNTHLIAAMALAQLTLPAMYKAGWGRIIFLSSTSAGVPFPGLAGYSASKAGLEGFARVVALEVAHKGVTVNCIAPGIIETDLSQNLVANLTAGGEGAERNIRKKIPVGFVGQPSDVAPLAALLCGEEGRYITGSIFAVDGGLALGAL